MNLIQQLIFYFIVFTGVFNIIRIFIYVFSSSRYSLWSVGKENKAVKLSITNLSKFPSILVVVPAYNEAKTIERTINSLNFINYPKNKIKIIIVDDGSKDNTKKVVYSIINKKNKINFNFELISKKNGGKADALNTAIKSTDFGELITCLDADSIVDKNFFINMSKYFKFKSIIAAASNVQITHNNTILGLIQMFEYLVSYQMKKSQSYLNIEYIIGGIGSTFRRSAIEEVGYYDTNTMTEDIDLTMKMINKLGNKNKRIIYASDAIAISQPVLKVKDLISQRFRWKFGRMQTLYKNKNVILSRNKKHGKLLTMFALPFAIFGELTLGLEFFIYMLIIFYAVTITGLNGLIYPLILSMWYAWYNIWYSNFSSKKDRILLLLVSPLMYFLMGFMMGIELIALFKCTIKLPFIKKTISNEKVSWKSPTRN